MLYGLWGFVFFHYCLGTFGYSGWRCVWNFNFVFAAHRQDLRFSLQLSIIILL